LGLQAARLARLARPTYPPFGGGGSVSATSPRDSLREPDRPSVPPVAVEGAWVRQTCATRNEAFVGNRPRRYARSASVTHPCDTPGQQVGGSTIATASPAAGGAAVGRLPTRRTRLVRPRRRSLSVQPAGQYPGRSLGLQPRPGGSPHVGLTRPSPARLGPDPNPLRLREDRHPQAPPPANLLPWPRPTGLEAFMDQPGPPRHPLQAPRPYASASPSTACGRSLVGHVVVGGREPQEEGPRTGGPPAPRVRTQLSASPSKPGT